VFHPFLIDRPELAIDLSNQVSMAAMGEIDASSRELRRFVQREVRRFVRQSDGDDFRFSRGVVSANCVGPTKTVAAPHHADN
jgi:hypothetical protein